MTAIITNWNTVKKYMITAIPDHTDRETGELDCTTLAEDAAASFNLYDDDEPDQMLFDLAFEVSEEYASYRDDADLESYQ